MHRLLAAEAVDRRGDEALIPGAPRRLDLRFAIAAGALGRREDPGIGGGERRVAEQAARRRARAPPGR